MLYNYIMETKYYLIAFLLCSVLLFLYFWKKTENFQQNYVDKLIHLNQNFPEQHKANKDPVLVNIIKNVLDDTPTCKTNPIKDSHNRDEDDLKLKYLHHLIKLNGLRWSLKKINQLEK